MGKDQPTERRKKKKIEKKGITSHKVRTSEGEKRTIVILLNLTDNLNTSRQKNTNQY